MIGVVEYTDQNQQRARVSLTDDGQWEGGDPEVVRLLTGIVSGDDYRSPAAGSFGFLMLDHAAQLLGGAVTQARDITPLPPGTIS